MTRIELNIGRNRAEIFVQIAAETGDAVRILATIDTGAQISLLPLSVARRIFNNADVLPQIEIQQAGLAEQYFSAREGVVRMLFEDTHGVSASVADVPCWFAETDEPLIGFDGVLDRATLYLDMRQTHTGWMELNG